MSDIAWDRPGEQAIQGVRKGDTVGVKVLDVDVDKERISLGIKQLSEEQFAGQHNLNLTQASGFPATLSAVGKKTPEDAAEIDFDIDELEELASSITKHKAYWNEITERINILLSKVPG